MSYDNNDNETKKSSTSLYADFINDMISRDDELSHAGRKGMKWGENIFEQEARKSQARSTRKRNASMTAQQRRSADKAALKKIKAKAKSDRLKAKNKAKLDRQKLKDKSKLDRLKTKENTKLLKLKEKDAARAQNIKNKQNRHEDRRAARQMMDEAKADGYVETTIAKDATKSERKIARDATRKEMMSNIGSKLSDFAISAHKDRTDRKMNRDSLKMDERQQKREDKLARQELKNEEKQDKRDAAVAKKEIATERQMNKDKETTKKVLGVLGIAAGAAIAYTGLKYLKQRDMGKMDVSQIASKGMPTKIIKKKKQTPDMGGEKKSPQELLGLPAPKEKLGLPTPKNPADTPNKPKGLLGLPGGKPKDPTPGSGGFGLSTNVAPEAPVNAKMSKRGQRKKLDKQRKNMEDAFRAQDSLNKNTDLSGDKKSFLGGFARGKATDVHNQNVKDMEKLYKKDKRSAEDLVKQAEKSEGLSRKFANESMSKYNSGDIKGAAESARLSSLQGAISKAARTQSDRAAKKATDAADRARRNAERKAKRAANKKARTDLFRRMSEGMSHSQKLSNEEFLSIMYEAISKGETLAHAGVPGMKWGVRKDRQERRASRPRRSQRMARRATYSVDTETGQTNINRRTMTAATLNKNRHLMSDEDLDSAIARLEKNKKIDELTLAEQKYKAATTKSGVDKAMDALKVASAVTTVGMAGKKVYDDIKSNEAAAAKRKMAEVGKDNAKVVIDAIEAGRKKRNTELAVNGVSSIIKTILDQKPKKKE